MPIIGGRQASVRGLGFQGAGAPAQVTGLSATNVGSGRAFNNGRIDLAWTAPATNGAPITGYFIERSTDGTNYSTLVANTGNSNVSYSDTGLTSAQQYWYRISAINAVGTGLVSTAANATATTVPQAPTIGTATAGNSQATVTFTANSTGGSAITTFTSTSSPAAGSGSSATSPITHTGLSNGTSYTFTVTATNANGTSLASAASNSVTPVNPVLNYFSTVAGPMDQYFQSTATNSSAAYHAGQFPIQPSNQPIFLVSYSKTGGVNWQRTITNTANYRYGVTRIAIDGAGNVITTALQQTTGGATDRRTFIGSINSSGTSNWLWAYNRQGASDFNEVLGLGIDSSNAIYSFANNGSDIYLFKVNSSGTAQWGRSGWKLGASVSSGGIAMTSAHVNTVHRDFFFVGKDSFINANVCRFELDSGNAANRYRLGTSDPAQQFISSAITSDSTGALYVSGYRSVGGFSGAITKIANGFGALTNAVFNVNVNFTGVATDSSNNVYAVGSNGPTLFVLKFDSSLNLLFQRTFSITQTGNNSNNPSIAIDSVNNKMVIGAIGNNNAFAFALPTDGSGTGIYTVGSLTFNYQPSSFTVSNQALSNSLSTPPNNSVNIERASSSNSIAAETRTITTTTF